MNKDMQFLVECLSEDIIQMLMDDYHYSIDQAADVLYNSHTYSLLENEKAELFYQGAVYVYDMLKQELEKQNIVNKYYDYMTARKVLKMTTKMVNERHNNYKLAQNGKRELIIIADAYYRDSLDMQMQARNDYFSKRAALEELVGSDVFKQFEQVVNNREK